MSPFGKAININQNQEINDEEESNQLNISNEANELNRLSFPKQNKKIGLSYIDREKDNPDYKDNVLPSPIAKASSLTKLSNDEMSKLISEKLSPGKLVDSIDSNIPKHTHSSGMHSDKKGSELDDKEIHYDSIISGDIDCWRY